MATPSRYRPPRLDRLFHMSPTPNQATKPDEIAASSVDYANKGREGLAEEMERDPSIFVVGEGIGVRGGVWPTKMNHEDHCASQVFHETMTASRLCEYIRLPVKVKFDFFSCIRPLGPCTICYAFDSRTREDCP